MNQNNKLIDIKGLTKTFGNKTVVDNINFSVDEGQIFGLLGPNGAGKTTLIRILSTLLQPTKGTAVINGNDILKKQMEVRRSIGLLPENPCIYEKLNVYENLKYFAALYDIPRNKRDNRIKDMLNLFDLKDRTKDIAGTLSKGLKQRLSLSITLLHNPRILFLDEPTSGLDISSKKNIRDLILELRNENSAVILSTHNIEEIEKICSMACIMNKGKILKIDKPNNLIKEFDVHNIEITLKDIDQNIISIIDSLDVNYSINENIIAFDNIKNPFEWCPLVVNKLVNAGGKIVYIKERTGLEEVYMGLVK